MGTVKATKTGAVRFNRKGDTGAQGRIGARMRIRDWAQGVKFLCGAEGETWYDVAVYLGKLYLCLVSHTSTSTTPQQSVANKDGRWELAQDWVFVATRLLLAERIKADLIETENIVARRILTDKENGYIEMSGGEMKVFGASAMNIRFGVRGDGMAVLEYYNNDGRKLYDLGPEGITMIPVSEESWTKGYLQYLGSSVQAVLSARAYKTKVYSESHLCWKYHSKRVAGVLEDAANDMCWFTSASKDSAKLADGIYRMMPTSASGNNVFAMYPAVGTGAVLGTDDLPNMSAHNEKVYDTAPLYFEPLYTMSGGILTLSAYVAYWNGAY